MSAGTSLSALCLYNFPHFQLLLYSGLSACLDWPDIPLFGSIVPYASGTANCIFNWKSNCRVLEVSTETLWEACFWCQISFRQWSL